MLTIPMVDQMNHPKPNQRIYIGGIDPSRGLTVSEVWQRLEAKLLNPGIDDVLKLQWSDLYCGSCCLQVTVAVVASSNDDMEQQSPLKLIKSSFHNVMWKGCKLIVDEARPHFLQRLQVERNLRQRTESLVDDNDMENGSPPITTSLIESQQLSRYWKVRRGYCGEAVRHVDTQSCDVTSWSMFERIRQRHKKQQEKDRLRRIELVKNGTNMTVKEAQKRAYYNRSIRLRFTDEMDINTYSSSVGNQLNIDDDTSSDQSIENSDDDGTSESNETSSKNQNEIGKYVWSDDDSCIADSEKVKTVSVPNVASIESFNTKVSSSHIQRVTNRGTYIWSDDENSLDSETSNDFTKRKQHIKPHDLGEFESALDLAKEHDGINMKEMNDFDDNDKYANDCDIAVDVERNLAILSQLFPETSKVPSVPHETKPVTDDLRETKSPLSTPQQTSSGWGASGQMLRFDPSRPQSTSFLLINDDEANKGDNPESNIGNANTSASSNKNTDQ